MKINITLTPAQARALDLCIECGRTDYERDEYGLCNTGVDKRALRNALQIWDEASQKAYRSRTKK